MKEFLEKKQQPLVHLLIHRFKINNWTYLTYWNTNAFEPNCIYDMQAQPLL